MTNPIPVDWYQPNSYTSTAEKRAERERIEAAAQANAPPNTVEVKIANVWHSSWSDRRDHATVDYKDIFERVERTHIYPGSPC
ncbi:hypothetical protein D6C76_09896 [Aureobasidium pullulans]|uniref:Uncharacterized protein n=1 Tax=Aureobasidium pullulans TaxID=5580 RepID=A0AB74JJJ4_AURPU|nr:hypothetical protein D6D12_08181 [Aureobasidium pullulans]THX36207.1 hypothetical protein D6D11_09465 [Aureobasidium pullulans]THX84700.1 hypothetical protein D6D08_04463 [Aureobasidium pullulans]TIA62962.1 hypothetical protein D6C76_09896 [Aureobasidium pullulans]